MSAVDAPNQPTRISGSREPRYEFGGRAAELFARFPSGQRVPVCRGRERHYPGLRSAAPDTSALYQAFSRSISGKHVLDAGAGSGLGTRILCKHVPHVTALDFSLSALEFGREYATGAEFLQADLCQGPAVDRTDAAVVVDVLGHVSHPESALRGLRACLSGRGQLFIAEPKAYPAQRLLAPACRAFSKAALTRLLLRCGFEVEDVALSGPSFVVVAARRSTDGATEALADGFRHAEHGRFEAARSDFARARNSERRELKLESLLGEADACFGANDGDGAVRCYFEAHELERGDGRALAGLARVALVTGDLEGALRLSLDALERDPTDASANGTMALAAEQLGHPDAFNGWRVAANLAPDQLDLATGLARVSAARRNFAFAIQVFERLRGYNDTQAAGLGVEFHVTFGWLLLAEGRKNDASVELRYAEALAPEHSGVLELRQALATG